MKRAIVLTAVLGAIGLVALACDDDHYGRRRHGSSCGSKTSCGTCTPVIGCGWCANAANGGPNDGTGTCVSDPDECEAPSRFNWEPEECPAVVVDGGGGDAAVVDSGRIPADAQVGEASTEEAGDLDGGDEAGENDL